jgi:anti-anti-sigma regulatory factor
MGIEKLSENVLLVSLPKEPHLISDELVTVNKIVGDGYACDVIIDFSSVTLLTSESISSLIILEGLLKGLGHKIILYAVSPMIQQILERTGIQPLFEFADDRSAALQSVQPSSSF